MKVISGLVLFILAGVSVYAQQSGKVIAEVAASNEKTIKNAPFSAEAISESIQTLADGNRIVRSSTAKMFRNSEGRFRTEMSGGAGGVLGTTFSLGQGATILDPVVGHRVMLDTLNGTARIATLGGGQNLTIVRGGVNGEMSEGRRVEIERKLATATTLTEAQRAEYAAKAKEYEQKAVELRAAAPAVAIAGSGGSFTTFNGDGGFAFATGSSAKYDTKTEELGTRDIEGVTAEGTRRVTTIPEGAIGNERPIEIVYERWYSKELGLVVYSKHSDPRFGEQTYRVTNIVRSEPDPSLFTVPQGYRVLAEPANVYRFTTAPTTVTAAGSVRPATKPTQVVNVKATKP
ncbi:MAG TPA: hypothetical protein PLK77_03145 [Pyrinomonadaceae bacterium]|nr:hypothetical protein [Pyrinomonadaceae bacterium]